MTKQEKPAQSNRNGSPRHFYASSGASTLGSDKNSPCTHPRLEKGHPKSLSDFSDTELDAEIERLSVRRKKFWKLQTLRKKIDSEERDFPQRIAEDGKIVDGIAAVVCPAFGIEPRAVYSVLRSEEITVPRMVIWHFLRKQSQSMSFKRIARVFNKDHGAIIHGIHRIKDRMETEPKLANLVASLEKKLQLS